MTKAQQREENAKLWKLACRAEFGVWFQSAAKIEDKAKKAITPKMNGMQGRIDEAIDYCETHKIPCRLINLKPRQGGSSTYFIGRAYWRARREPCNVAILGDDKNTTDLLLKKWKFFGEQDLMASYWGNAPKTVAWEEFNNESTLILETANDPRAGQGATLQCLIASEVASYRASGHSTGEDVFSSIASTVPDLPGTLVALESTAQGSTGIFYTTYQGAVTFEQFKAGERGNGYIKFFTPWFEFVEYQHDGRDGRFATTPFQRQKIEESLDDREQLLIKKHGAEVITVERLAWRRATIASPKCGGDPDKFDREYPSDEVSCFQSTGSAYFDAEGLLWQEKAITGLPFVVGDIDVQDRAVFWRERSQNSGWCRIWEHPQDGESYLMAADWCVGKQAAGSKRERDTNAIGVWRAARLDAERKTYRPAMLVAALKADDRTPTDVALQRLLALYRYYGDCIVVPEINNKDNICQQMMTLGVTNIWTQREGADGASPGQGKTQEVHGFLTTGTRDGGGTRRQITSNMQRCVREQEFVCSCPTLLEQMKKFIVDATGKCVAAPGCHDDWVMMTAIALFCMPAATPYVATRLMSAQKGPGYQFELHVMDPRGL